MKHPERGPNAALGEGYTYVAVGMTFALTVVGAALLGLWLDRRFGTMPILTLVGTLLGVGLGGFWVWARLEAERQADRDGEGE